MSTDDLKRALERLLEVGRLLKKAQQHDDASLPSCPPEHDQDAHQASSTPIHQAPQE